MIATKTILSNHKMKNRSSKRVDAQPGKQLCEFQKLVDHQALEGEAYSSYEDRQEMVSSSFVGKPSVQFSNKRRATDIVEGQKKRQKMDRSATQYCCMILKTLMTHPAGWVFNHPVDPVALNIPDYFSIVSEPMDLGTIKSRLEGNIYLETDRFAADVRLTFSNAMCYNPPSNSVHKMASELSEIFETRWKLLEEKWHERSKFGQGKPSFEQVKDFDDTRNNNRNKASLLRVKSLPSNSSSSEKRVIRLSLKPKDVAEEFFKTANPRVNESTVKNFNKGTDTARTHVSSKCASCDCIPCHCIFSSDVTRVSSDDLSSERSLIRDPLESVNSCKLTYEVKVFSNSSIPKSDSHSEGWKSPGFKIQLSPKKALRAVMLKSRFADTILKAQQKALLDPGDQIDPFKMQQEKEKLERRQRQERERIEEQIKAVEAGTRKRAEAELKQQREAARLAIKMMKKTVELDQNLEFLRELEILSGKTILFQQPGTPLERLGLYFKDEFVEDEDEETMPR